MKTSSLDSLANLEGKRALVIIPAYNESSTINQVLRTTKKILKQMKAKHRIQGDIVVVNDGSQDHTPELASRARVFLIHHQRNQGYGASIRTGLNYAINHDYDAVVLLDADGQHDPNYIPDLLLPVLREEVDIVNGSRFLGSHGYQVPPVRLAGIKFFSWVTSILTRQKISDVTSGLRAFNRRLMTLFKEVYPDRFPSVIAATYLDHRLYRFTEVPTLMRPRVAGASELTPVRVLIYLPSTFTTVIAIIYFRFLKLLAHTLKAKLIH